MIVIDFVELESPESLDSLHTLQCHIISIIFSCSTMDYHGKQLPQSTYVYSMTIVADFVELEGSEL